MTEFNCWKVVREVGYGTYYSAVPVYTNYTARLHQRESSFLVQYRIGLRSIPKPGCGPLAVFCVLDCALEFAKQCVFHPSVPIRILSAWAEGLRCPPDFGRALWTPRSQIDCKYLANGTFLADAVTLIQTTPDGSPAP